MAFDVLQADGIELITLPYKERRRRLEVLFASRGLTAPWTLCPMTTDLAEAREWLETWTDVSGVEGLVIKNMNQRYLPRARGWEKIRHSENVDADVIGFTGTAARPRHLVVRLPNGRMARSQQLTAPLAAQVALFLRGAGPAAEARTSDGEPYQRAAEGLVVEVAAGTTRHAVVTVVRVRG
ncbi:hypothetical protein [Streptomyces sp. NPDC017949]|uniref:ATP-dependent DNA ligase n=1 Tax=Streptomyces sp. NPDC017949 TaxID=3365020 RepID=UPI0037B3408C